MCTLKSESVFSILNISFIVFCAEMLAATIFTNAKRLLTSCVSLKHSEIYTAKINWTRRFDNPTQKIEIVFRVR